MMVLFVLFLSYYLKRFLGDIMGYSPEVLQEGRLDIDSLLHINVRYEFINDRYKVFFVFR